MHNLVAKKVTEALMNKFTILLILCLVTPFNANAAIWVNLHEDSVSKLMLDKESILEKDGLKKAWVKIEYKVPQKNNELVEKEYNVSKLLWYFDCSSEKAATSQIFQYYKNEIVYSAAIEPKSAQFLEPIPDTDMDISMRHVCGPKKAAPVKTPDTDSDKSKSDKANVDSKASEKPNAAKASGDKSAPDAKGAEASKPAVAAVKPAGDKGVQDKSDAVTKTAPAKNELAVVSSAKAAALATKPEANKPPRWAYEGKEGPENWAKLSPEFAMCETGRNQSPINVDSTIHAVLKPLKTIQKFAAKEILNNGRTIQVNFKEGNMMVFDSAAYQLKQVQFHAPSENTIHGESFPLEAHFVHADSKGNLTVIAVLFKEGKENEGLTRLWEQLPAEEGPPASIKSRVLPTDLIPKNPTYFRFSGSLTTPPCSEGVRWVLMKTPMTASKEQIEAFKKAMHHNNNRPIQALNGRAVLE
ncbi:MAG TPA: surface-adhesin E family protein [Methylophilaceae bacterium]|jgi:carbonic anhydrase